jgi:hypothetical protein
MYNCRKYKDSIDVKIGGNFYKNWKHCLKWKGISKCMREIKRVLHLKMWRQQANRQAWPGYNPQLDDKSENYSFF